MTEVVFEEPEPLMEEVVFVEPPKSGNKLMLYKILAITGIIAVIIVALILIVFCARRRKKNSKLELLATQDVDSP
jgi:hypothetical protein